MIFSFLHPKVLLRSISRKATFNETYIPPASPPPQLKQGNFCIKVETFEKDLQKFTGYSYDSDIIPLTIDFCEKHRKDDRHTCSPPIVTTSQNVSMVDMIFVEDYKYNNSYVHFVKKAT